MTGQVTGKGTAADLAQDPVIAAPAVLLAFERRAARRGRWRQLPAGRFGSHESSITVPAIIQAMK